MEVKQTCRFSKAYYNGDYSSQRLSRDMTAESEYILTFTLFTKEISGENLTNIIYTLTVDSRFGTLQN